MRLFIFDFPNLHLRPTCKDVTCTNMTQPPQSTQFLVPRCRSLFLVAFCVIIIVITGVTQLSKITMHKPGYLVTQLNNESFLSSWFFSISRLTDSSQQPKIDPPPTPAPDIKKLFYYALSEKDAEMMSDLLKVFHQIMVNSSITYFLFHGSLLGSYRHHGIIPWDDDLDVLVHFNDKNKMKEAFRTVSPRYKMDCSTHRFKFYNVAGHVVYKPWKTPFMDICFYRDNSTYLWDIAVPKQGPFHKSDIFPLRDRPFLGSLYPAPRDPLRTLQCNYKVDDCYTGWYNHSSESWKRHSAMGQVPCSALLDVIPFVQHGRGPGGAWCEEVLKVRGHVINTFVRDSNGIPVC